MEKQSNITKPFIMSVFPHVRYQNAKMQKKSPYIKKHNIITKNVFYESFWAW